MSKRNEKTILKNNYMIIFIPKNIMHLCIMQKFIKKKKKNYKKHPFLESILKKPFLVKEKIY